MGWKRRERRRDAVFREDGLRVHACGESRREPGRRALPVLQGPLPMERCAVRLCVLQRTLPREGSGSVETGRRRGADSSRRPRARCEEIHAAFRQVPRRNAVHGAAVEYLDRTHVQSEREGHTGIRGLDSLARIPAVRHHDRRHVAGRIRGLAVQSREVSRSEGNVRLSPLQGIQGDALGRPVRESGYARVPRAEGREGTPHGRRAPWRVRDIPVVERILRRDRPLLQGRSRMVQGQARLPVPRLRHRRLQVRRRVYVRLLETALQGGGSASVDVRGAGQAVRRIRARVSSCGGEER